MMNRKRLCALFCGLVLAACPLTGAGDGGSDGGRDASVTAGGTGGGGGGGGPDGGGAGGGTAIDASVPEWCHRFPTPTRLSDGGYDLDSGIFTHFMGMVEDAGLMAGDIAPLLGCFTNEARDLDPFDAGLIVQTNPKHYQGCATRMSDCPPSDAGAIDRWFFAPDATVPFNPRGEDDAGTEPPASGDCQSGMGFSFERGTYAPWTPSGPAWGNVPVYGNNVSIDRIRPPGYVSSGASAPLTAVGGDYWEFSRDIGYVGNYWLGSSDVRGNWRTTPGARVDGTLGGALTSPVFRIVTGYLSFFIGGAKRAGQRVELVIIGNANNHDALLASYRGIGVEETPPGSAFTHEPTANNIVVRASTGIDDGEYMRRRVYWNVNAYLGQMAYFRVIDTAGPNEHVNADDFRCEKSPPTGAHWLPAPDGGATLVGEIVRDVPLWGATDTHAHVVANLTFGGHYIWGDPDDDIANVYDCHRPLGEIKTRSGEIIRPAISTPAQYTGCYLNTTLIATMNAVGSGICAVTASALLAIPFAGPFLAAAELTACAIALTAATTVLVGLAQVPSVITITQHGASMPTSGGIRVGPLLDWLISLFTNRIEPIHGLLELQDWDLQDGSHSGFGLGRSHQRYHKTMIRRAYQGGLRLMVIDALNSRAMQYVLDAQDTSDDWTAIRTTVEGVKRLVASDTDSRYTPGPLRDIAEIALTPGQARDIIRRNKLAIILGTEVQELGKARFAGDTAEAQVRDLYDLGIRKITAIHGVNNPLGGTGFFNDIYNSAGVFNNLTRNEVGMASGSWQPLLPVGVFLPSIVPPPLSSLSLGDYRVFRSLKPDAPCTESSCPWNLKNGAWFSVQDALHADADFIGGTSDITFRVGIEGSKNGRTTAEHDPFSNPGFQFASKLDTLEWLLGVGPGGVVANRRCSLDGMFFPLVGELDSAAATNYASSTHHMNDTGLSTLGSEFITSMMKRGMVVDTDHFGQKTRVEAFSLFARFRDEAGGSLEYPAFGIHTDTRRYQRHGPYPIDDPAYASTLGFGAETDKTVAELEHIRDNGGMVSPGVNGGVVLDPDNLVQTQVNNNCDYTSKTFATKYLQTVRLMKGRGVANSTDMNSPSPPLRSRYATAMACMSNDEPGRLDRRIDEDGMPVIASWPRDWAPENVAACRFNSVTGDHPECPSSTLPYTQVLEFDGVEYDDYATRAAHPFWSPPSNAPATARYIIAQTATEVRDDGALAGRSVTHAVAYGGGGPLRQLRPMHKFRTDFITTANNRGWDVNIDGMTNEGMLPDVWQDMRNVGVSWEQMGPLFNSAGDFIDMWERGCRMGAAWATAHGTSPLAGCD